jgi:hypothetical protein
LTNIDALKELKELESLDLAGCTRLSEEAVHQLRAALPLTKIKF